MKKFRVLLGLLVVLLLGGGVAIGLFVKKVLAAAGGTTMVNTTTVLRQVQTLSQLVTVKYVMEKVVIFEDVKWYPGGDNRVLLVAHGIVKAGVDFEKLKPSDLQVQDQTVRIKLPPAQITDCYLDDAQTQVVERTTGLLRTFDKDLEQNARKQAVDDVRRAARLAGIVKDAEERARAQVEKLFQQMGLTVEFQGR